MHIKAVFASTLIFYSYSFGMEQTNKYDAWKRISLSKRWRNSNCTGKPETILLAVDLPPISTGVITLHDGECLEFTPTSESATHFHLGNLTFAYWQRQRNSTKNSFFYPVICVDTPKIVWLSEIENTSTQYFLSKDNESAPVSSAQMKLYKFNQSRASEWCGFRTFHLTNTRNEIVCKDVFVDNNQEAFGNVDSCDQGFLVAIQYEFKTKKSYLLWMDPLTSSHSSRLRVELSGELKPKDFDKIYLFYTPDGTYCTFIYDNQYDVPICLIWWPGSRGIFFDENFKKLHNIHFAFSNKRTR